MCCNQNEKQQTYLCSENYIFNIFYVMLFKEYLIYYFFVLS